MNNPASTYRTILLIRRFEERLLNEFSTGKISGTTHTCIGQEADAVGVISVMGRDDIIFSNHRCHGHFLAYGGDPYHLAAELMGKKTGLVGGRGGSQHIHWRNFYSNGIQGGIIPIAVGMAFAEKEKKTGNCVLVFAGDGTMGEGVLYESMNMAALWKLPVMFIVENNRYAQTTPIELAVAGSISARFSAFGIPVWEKETTDALEIQSTAKEVISHIRKEGSPACLIIHTYRFAAHSKGDDVRDPDEIRKAREKDPLIVAANHVSPEERLQTGKEIDALIDESFRKAEADPFPQIDEGTLFQ
jgi:TPP-dependent pyruvate/acetoin dehydrogenase alpha subunit